MAWNDDSWRDTYDAWKLASPYDDYDEPEDDCMHEDYELDILTGRAECNYCDHRWFMSDAEMQRHHELMAQPYPADDSDAAQPDGAILADDEVPF